MSKNLGQEEKSRSVRGGCWAMNEGRSNVAARWGSMPGITGAYLCLRVVLMVKK